MAHLTFDELVENIKQAFPDYEVDPSELATFINQNFQFAGAASVEERRYTLEQRDAVVAAIVQEYGYAAALPGPVQATVASQAAMAANIPAIDLSYSNQMVAQLFGQAAVSGRLLDYGLSHVDLVTLTRVSHGVRAALSRNDQSLVIGLRGKLVELFGAGLPDNVLSNLQWPESNLEMQRLYHLVYYTFFNTQRTYEALYKNNTGQTLAYFYKRYPDNAIIRRAMVNLIMGMRFMPARFSNTSGQLKLDTGRDLGEGFAKPKKKYKNNTETRLAAVVAAGARQGDPVMKLIALRIKTSTGLEIADGAYQWSDIREILEEGGVSEHVLDDLESKTLGHGQRIIDSYAFLGFVMSMSAVVLFADDKVAQLILEFPKHPSANFIDIVYLSGLNINYFPYLYYSLRDFHLEHLNEFNYGSHDGRAAHVYRVFKDRHPSVPAFLDFGRRILAEGHRSEKLGIQTIVTAIYLADDPATLLSRLMLIHYLKHNFRSLVFIKDDPFRRYPVMPHPRIHLIPHDPRVRKPEYVFVKGRLPKDIGASEDQVRVYGVDVTGDEYCYIDHPDAAKLISDWRKRQRTAMEADVRQKAVCRPWQSVVPLALASDSSSSQHVSEVASPAAANASPVQSNFNHFGLWQQPTYCAGNVASVSNTASAAAAAASAAADVADMPAASTTTANTTATAVAPGSMVGVKRRLFDSDDTKDDADLNLTHLEASGDLLELPLAKRARLIGLGGAAGAAGAAAAGTLSDDDSESYLARVTSLQR